MPRLPSRRRVIRSTGVLIAGLVVAVVTPAPAATRTRNVLVLYTDGRLLPADIEIDRGIRDSIETTANRPVMVYDEFLDLPNFTGPEYFRTLAEYLRKKYGSRPPDVFIAAGEPVLEFLLEQHDQLFPQAPIVHVAMSPKFLRSSRALPANVVGVPLEFDFSGTIDLALRLHPRAGRLVIVTGASPFDHEMESRLRVEVLRFKDRATVEFLTALPAATVLKRLGALGDDAVVFTPGYFQDGDGRTFTPRDAVSEIAAASSAPVYGPFSTFIGTGIVGGSMASFEAIGRQGGQIVSELLAGSSPASLRLPAITPNTVNVDWRQVQRWGIDDRLIPANAVVQFREPTFFAQHRAALFAAAAVFSLQAGLIVWLLAERRRRRSAEQAEHHHRLELAHASRLAIAGELTAAIAHEINQPLGAILSNADAADLILESGADRRDVLKKILADIRRDDLRASEIIRRLRTLLNTHTIEPQSFDLSQAVGEVELLLREEAKRRRVTFDVRPGALPVKMVGDRIQIQQVLINLGLNAMDAVADAPEGRRVVVVSMETLPSGIDIAVRDRGHGITLEDQPKLFESFFTTKRTGMGLGLSIARTLVEAHGGRIWAENGQNDGAVFHVEFPGAAAAPLLSRQA